MTGRRQLIGKRIVIMLMPLRLRRRPRAGARRPALRIIGGRQHRQYRKLRQLGLAALGGAQVGAAAAARNRMPVVERLQRRPVAIKRSRAAPLPSAATNRSAAAMPPQQGNRPQLTKSVSRPRRRGAGSRA